MAGIAVSGCDDYAIAQNGMMMGPSQKPAGYCIFEPRNPWQLLATVGRKGGHNIFTDVANADSRKTSLQQLMPIDTLVHDIGFFDMRTF